MINSFLLFTSLSLLPCFFSRPSTIEEDIIKSIHNFLITNSSKEIFDTNVLNDQSCSQIFNQIQTNFTFVVESASSSGLNSIDFGAEDNCLSKNKTYIFITYDYDVTKHRTTYYEQYYYFNEDKTFSRGWCLWNECYNWYNQLFNMKNNTELSNYLYEFNIENIDHYPIQSNLNPNIFTNYYKTEYRMKSINNIVIASVIYIIFRLFLSIIYYLTKPSSDALDDSVENGEDVNKTENKIKAWVRNDIETDDNQLNKEEFIFKENKKKVNVCKEFSDVFNISKTWTYLSEQVSIIYNEKDVIELSGWRFLIWFFILLEEVAELIPKLPKKEMTILSLFKGLDFSWLKCSQLSFESYKVVLGIIFGFKLMTYIKCNNGDQIQFKHMLKFYMKSVYYIIVFCIIHFGIQIFTMEAGWYISPSTKYIFFTETYVINKECLREPYKIFIPFYFQYIYTERDSCYKSALFSMSEFYCFTFMMIFVYTVLKIKKTIFEVAIFVINCLGIFLLYFIMNSSVYDSDITLSKFYASDETLQKPHIFILLYYLGFNIGVMFYYYKNWTDVYAEYNEVLQTDNNNNNKTETWKDKMEPWNGDSASMSTTSSKSKTFMPFIYNYHFMIFLSKKAKWFKICLSVFSLLFLILITLSFTSIYNYKLRQFPDNTIIIKGDLAWDIAYKYEGILFGLCTAVFITSYLFCVADSSLVLSIMGSSIFGIVNKISFAFFNLTNMVISVFLGMYNIDIYLNVRLILEMAMALFVVIYFIAFCFVLIYEVPVRILFRYVCGETTLNKKKKKKNNYSG